MTPEELDRRLGEHTRRALDAQQRLEELVAGLAGHPDPGGARETRLVEAIEQRDAALGQLGLLLLQAARQGATPALRWPVEPAPEEETPQEEPAPAPAPAAPTPQPSPLPAPPRAVLVAPPQPAAPPPPRRPPTPLPEPEQAEVLHRILDGLGPPRRMETLSDYQAEMQRILHAAQEVDSWTALPRGAQRALVGMCATRSRHLQDEAAPYLGVSREVVSNLNAAFSLLTRFSAEHRPGFVKGLSRNQRPDVGLTWLDHALSWWDDLVGRLGAPAELSGPDHEEVLTDLRVGLDEDREPDVLRFLVQRCLDAGLSPVDPRLVELLLGCPEVLSSQTSFQALHQRISAARAEQGSTRRAEDDALPPAELAQQPDLHGDGLVVGADAPPAAMERVRMALGLDELHWEPGWRSRKVDALVQRIRDQDLALVICLAPLSSAYVLDQVRSACEATSTPCVDLDGDLGIHQVSRALESRS